MKTTIIAGGCVSRVPCYAKDPIRNERVCCNRQVRVFWEVSEGCVSQKLKDSPVADKPLHITTKPTTSFSLLVLVCNYQPIVVCYASPIGTASRLLLQVVNMSSPSRPFFCTPWVAQRYGVLNKFARGC